MSELLTRDWLRGFFSPLWHILLAACGLSSRPWKPILDSQSVWQKAHNTLYLATVAWKLRP